MDSQQLHLIANYAEAAARLAAPVVLKSPQDLSSAGAPGPAAGLGSTLPSLDTHPLSGPAAAAQPGRTPCRGSAAALDSHPSAERASTHDRMSHLASMISKEGPVDLTSGEFDWQRRAEGLEAAFEHAPFMLLVLDANGRVEGINRAGLQFAGRDKASLLGADCGQALGCPTALEPGAPPCSNCPVWRSALHTLQTGQPVLQTEGQLRLLRNGPDQPATETDLLISTSPLQIGHRPRVMVIIEDVTDRRQAERRLRQGLEERELLLREVHHRVKNNLTVIISLLELQARRVQDPVARQALEDSRSRVFSISLVHNHLYRASDLGQVRLREYLTGLGETVFTVQSTNARVHLDLDIADVVQPLDRVIAIGLVANELLSNTLRHAFPGSRAGRVQLSLQPVGNHLRLAVTDDGVGLPPGFEVEQCDSLGLHIVRSLALQLNGALSIIQGEKTAFLVTFPQGE